MTELIFCLMGPTASGKTNIALDLVQTFPFEIISVDSALIYRQMDIGTAKLSKAQLEQVPHHLVDIIDPIESYSAAMFCKDAQALIKTIIDKGKMPLLVGGSMMYFKALQEGLSQLPEKDEALRLKLEEEASLHGWETLHQRLSLVDPVMASRIHCHDSQRIARGLEVFYLTGSSLSDHGAIAKAKSPYQFVNLALFPKNRAWLHERIAARFDEMLEAGLVLEVKRLLEHWPLDLKLPSMRAVGYRQVLEHLQNKTSHQSLRDKGICATRQLAKRQLTWLKSWADVFYFDPEEKTCLLEIVAKIKEILDNLPFE